MIYRFRKPELIPTLVMLVVVTLMFSLGGWQLYRLQWKNTLIAHIEEAQSQAPSNLFSTPTSRLPQIEWQNVMASGLLMHDKELYATPRYLQEKLGYAVLTPLAVNTSTGVKYILVNRGWVAPEKKDPLTRLEGNPTAPVIVEGTLRNPLPQGLFRPDNSPDKNLWFWYDVAAMAKKTHLPLLPVLIDATNVKTQHGDVLKGGPTPFPLEIKIRNDHLGYAITWFLIGISALVIFGVYYSEKK